MGCELEVTNKKAKPIKARKLDLPPGVPPLTSLYMYIAGSCNLACRHCWIEPEYQGDTQNGNYLKFEFIKRAIREAKPLGLQTVKLTGGEPMLHPQFRHIVDHVDSQGIGIILETNGTLIDAKTAQFLRSKDLVSFVSISLDGAKPETHDRLRGVTGSFKRAITGIDAMGKAGLSPQIICTLHKGNISELEDTIQLASSLGCSSVKFNFVQQMGRGSAYARENGLGVEEILSLVNAAESAILNKHRIKVYFDVPIAFKPIRNLLNSNSGRCMILNILGILADGSVSICGIGVSTPELVFGHLATSNLASIWKDSMAINAIRRAIPDRLEGTCSECVHRIACVGTCVANNYHRAKRFTAPYFFCQDTDRIGIFPLTRKIKYNSQGVHP